MTHKILEIDLPIVMSPFLAERMQELLNTASSAQKESVELSEDLVTLSMLALSVFNTQDGIFCQSCRDTHAVDVIEGVARIMYAAYILGKQDGEWGYNINDFNNQRPSEKVYFHLSIIEKQEEPQLKA